MQIAFKRVKLRLVRNDKRSVLYSKKYIIFKFKMLTKPVVIHIIKLKLVQANLIGIVKKILNIMKEENYGKL